MLRIAEASLKLDDNPYLGGAAAISPGTSMPLGVTASVLAGPDHVTAVQFIEAVKSHFVEGVSRPLNQAILKNLAAQPPDAVMVKRLSKHALQYIHS